MISSPFPKAQGFWEGREGKPRLLFKAEDTGPGTAAEELDVDTLFVRDEARKGLS
jgi:hypothetical protein